MSIKINKNGKEYPLGFMPEHYPADRVYLDGDTTKNVQGAIDELAGKIKKKSYTFSSSTENCMVTDLNTANSVIIGIKTTDRIGWNLIARNGVSGNTYPDKWAITTSDGKTFSGTFNIDVYYI